MIQGCVSWVKAAQDFFGKDGRPLSVTEMQALTTDDRADLHAMLSGAGYELSPLTIKGNDAALAASA